VGLLFIFYKQTMLINYSFVVVCVWVVKCLKTVKRKSQNLNKSNEIDSEKTSMNARVT